MYRTVAVAGRLGLVGVKRNIQGRQIIDDVVHRHLKAMDTYDAFETVSLECIQHSSHARRAGDEPDRSRYRTLRRMARMGRQYEYFALIDANVSDLSLVDDPQDHIAFTLIEELRDRIAAKIDPRIRPKMICAIMPHYSSRSFLPIGGLSLSRNWSIQWLRSGGRVQCHGALLHLQAKKY